MEKARPSSEQLLVSPVIACLVEVYAAELGRGLSAEMEPLLMMRPPCGDCAFIRRKACCEHRKGAVRLVATAWFHCSRLSSSNGRPGVKVPG